MKHLIFISSLILISFRLLSQNTDSPVTDDFGYYKEMNDKELRLIEFKDNDEALRIKLIQLDIINKSRKKFKAGPVRLDILASRVANKMSKEAAENNFVSHWNLAGEKPYHRYAFAGGNDHVSENAFGEWASYTYDKSFSHIAEMMKNGHGTFMKERAPADGHKKNIIDKTHNWVGIGFFIIDNQFRYYEEFIDRYFEFENTPTQLKINEQGSITVKTDGNNFLYYLIIYREKIPSGMKVSQLDRKGSYQDFSNEEYMKMPAWDLALYRNVSTYEIPLKFTKEGLYYIHIFFDKKEITRPSNLNTKGKPEGCGIVIKANK
jgi:hypothetical protein